MSRRNIVAVTVGRSDYGILRPVLKAIQAEPSLDLAVVVSGMHLSSDFGRTGDLIEKDGIPVAERVEMLLGSDTPEAVAKSMGLGTIGFAGVYARRKPDLILTIGDRTEMHAAVIAALPFRIPVAHIHGGEISQGAIDDSLRHSMTKLSHLHFVATEEYAARVRQMGEEDWRVTVSGAPGLDNVHLLPMLSAQELETRFGIRLDRPPLVVTYHPVTLEFDQAGAQAAELLAALEAMKLPIVFTQPNADTGGRAVQAAIERYVAGHDDAWLVDNLGTQAYFSVMKYSAAMVGNSSSGLIEAPAFHLPVVNIGTRQGGRCRGENVIDVGATRTEIEAGIRRAISPEFRAGVRTMANPYGDGHASGLIVERLKSVSIDDRLIRKMFRDAPRESRAKAA